MKKPEHVIRPETWADVASCLRAGEFPGGYQLWFTTADGQPLSFDAVRECAREVCWAMAHPGADPQWQIVALTGSHETDPPEWGEGDLVCSHTGEVLMEAEEEPEPEDPENLVDEAWIPEWAVCYLMYGDSDDLGDEEIAQADEWYSQMANWTKRSGYGYFVLDFTEDRREFFSAPAFGLATSVVKARILGFGSQDEMWWRVEVEGYPDPVITLIAPSREVAIRVVEAVTERVATSAAQCQPPTPILTDTTTMYGAKMGRASWGLLAKPYHVSLVDIDHQGYDRGGAYWGINHTVWAAVDPFGRQLFALLPKEAALIHFESRIDGLNLSDYL